MNEDNNVITMDCESVAVLLQKIQKESRWLSGFFESYRPPLDGERYLTDKEVAELLRVSRPDLAGIPQQQDITFYPVGRKGALSGIGTARSIGSKL